MTTTGVGPGAAGAAGAGVGPLVVVRPGSRLARLGMPLAKDALRALADKYGVCVRPLAFLRIDTVTGRAEALDVACGARLASQCRACAERNRRDRITQILEGWHLDEEPRIEPARPTSVALAMAQTRAHLEFARDEAEREADFVQVTDIEDAISQVDTAMATEGNLRGLLTPRGRKAGERKKRSTRRRQDAPDLPRLKVEDRTIGRAYATRKGTVRPSMFVTVTLPSYGDVHTEARPRRGKGLEPCRCGALHGRRDPLLGTPLDPTSYDYRRAALDAIHFAKVVDRWWQNLRRAVGWKVQYAGCVELQKRLAPHGHFAVRGTIPRKVLRQVAAATYHQVWWPPFDTAVYRLDRPPVWDAGVKGYCDPGTGVPLPTWDEAIDVIDNAPTNDDDDGDVTDNDADGNGDRVAVGPADVARLGQVHAQGVTAGDRDTGRAVRYITKYLTKDIAEHAGPKSPEQDAHFDRMHRELSTLPCSPTCANWLLYGVQPDGAKPNLVPGRCSGKVHQRKTLGFSGRRCLISRQWSLRTLADVRADKRAWIKSILAGNLDGSQHADVGPDGQPLPPAMEGDGDRRYVFELARPGSPGVPPVEYRVLRSISAKISLREAIDKAKRRQGMAGGVDGTAGGVSATAPARAA